MSKNTKWMDWAVELQALAQAGLYYSKDIFDTERYQRIRDISAEILAEGSDMPIEKLKELFFCETGYQTPKLGCRAAMVCGDKILLVQERDGLWTLPGGWADVGLSIAENTVKEVYEEAGLWVQPRLIVAVHDKDKNNQPPFAFKIIEHFLLCDILGGEFKENSETVASDWFTMDELPPLNLNKTTPEQIELCLKAAHSEHWQTVFD